MNSDQIGGLVRTILTFVVGLFAGKLHLDGATSAAIVADLSGLVVAGWSIWSNRSAGLVASVSAMPSVDSGKLAAAISDPTLKDAAKP
jgi:hypothetical protein